MAHRFDFTVQSTDIDVIGHVNNAKYLEYMEWARFDWIWKQGFTLDELKRREVMPVVVNININYRKELLMREKVYAITTVVSASEKSFVLRHVLYNEAEQLVADGDVTMVMIDAKTRRSISLPADLMEALHVELAASQEKSM